MTYKLSVTEEQNIYRLLVKPYLLRLGISVNDKKFISSKTLLRPEKTILLLESFCFSFDSILAGLSEKNIEYITKNAPAAYKKNYSKGT